MVKWLQLLPSLGAEGTDDMTYILAILVVVVSVGAAVVFWRWRLWTRDDGGLGARLNDHWEGWEDER